MSGVLVNLLGRRGLQMFTVAVFSLFGLARIQAAETQAVWIDKEAKLLDSEIVRAVSEQDSRVLNEGGIKTLTTAMTVIVNNGRGVFCKAKMSGDLKDLDVLKYEGTKVTTDDQAKLDITELSFSKASARLLVWCVSKGDITTQELKENTDIILATRGADGKFPVVTQDTINEEHQRSRIRQQDLRLKNLEKLITSGQINKNQELVNALVDGGRLVPFDEGIELVYSGRAKMACSVVRMSPKAKVGDVYKLKNLVPMGADRENGVGNMQYHYEDQEGRQLVYTCALRLSAKVSAVFSVFDGILEF